MIGTLGQVNANDRAPTGSSVWEKHLWTHLVTHVEEERHLIEEYSVAARETQSKAFGYLINLLVEDEIRHHRIFMELAASLKTDVESGRKPPAIPYMDIARADEGYVLEVTERLLEREEQDARDLKQLQNELREVKDTSLWGLLVDLMQRDTQKHIAILRFAKRHSGRRGR
jgi:hypothetical protein